MTAADPMEAERKRLMWRATRRGIREMDAIVGGFAQKHLPHMDAAELRMFAALLEIPDQDLLAYATRQQPVPAELTSPMLTDLLLFRPAVRP